MTSVRIGSLAACFTLSSAAFGQFPSNNVQLLAHLSSSDLGVNEGANDSWGYVSPSGREYAIVCTRDATVFIDITVPTSPQVIDHINAPVGTWRDAKVYGEYCYSVCESSCNGVQVIDMTQIDSGTISLANTFNGAGTGATHNVAIDEVSGYLYRCGGGSNGIRIYDLNANPTDPPFVGSWGDQYVHDAHVVTYASGPFAGTQMAVLSTGGFVSSGVTWLDVTNKSNMMIMSQIFYAGAEYSHQGWLSEDYTTYYHGDELDEGNLNIDTTTFVFDCTDPYNTSLLGSYTNGNSAIGHNIYTRGDLIFQANNTSGLRVHDAGASRTNPPEVGFLDTYPSSDAKTYAGTWSCYPYLPSGVVVISNRESANAFMVAWFGDPLIGENFCSPATLNSSGLPARIHATGSADVSSNNVTLLAMNMPSNEFGYFLASMTTGGFTPPGSSGMICLGVPIARFNTQAQNSGVDGTFSVAVDLTNIPLTPPVAVMSGETWHFQGWFRDGATSNFTDGTSVEFF